MPHIGYSVLGDETTAYVLDEWGNILDQQKGRTLLAALNVLHVRVPVDGKIHIEKIIGGKAVAYRVSS